jgi:hypothetical protein
VITPLSIMSDYDYSHNYDGESQFDEPDDREPAGEGSDEDDVEEEEGGDRDWEEWKERGVSPDEQMLRLKYLVRHYSHGIVKFTSDAEILPMRLTLIELDNEGKLVAPYRREMYEIKRLPHPWECGQGEWMLIISLNLIAV